MGGTVPRGGHNRRRAGGVCRARGHREPGGALSRRPGGCRAPGGTGHRRGTLHRGAAERRGGDTVLGGQARSFNPPLHQEQPGPGLGGLLVPGGLRAGVRVPPVRGARGHGGRGAERTRVWGARCALRVSAAEPGVCPRGGSCAAEAPVSVPLCVRVLGRACASAVPVSLRVGVCLSVCLCPAVPAPPSAACSWGQSPLTRAPHPLPWGSGVPRVGAGGRDHPQPDACSADHKSAAAGAGSGARGLPGTQRTGAGSDEVSRARGTPSSPQGRQQGGLSPPVPVVPCVALEASSRPGLARSPRCQGCGHRGLAARRLRGATGTVPELPPARRARGDPSCGPVLQVTPPSVASGDALGGGDSRGATEDVG